MLRSRKNALTFSTAALAATLMLPTFADAAAKNVILMISDGMGYNQMAAANDHREYAYGNSGAGMSAYYQMWENGLHNARYYGMSTYSVFGSYDPSQAWIDNGDGTYSYSDYVKSNATDSASAGSAMYTGVKIKDGQINVDPFDNTIKLTTIAEIADAYGKATGAVSSVQLSHATPGAVWAHNTSRGSYADIANEMFDSGLDVIIGAGHPGYDTNGQPASKSSKYVGGDTTWANLQGGYDGWTLVEEKSDFEAIASGAQAAPDRLLGVAQSNSTIQHDRSATNLWNDNVPSLATMTRAAIRTLEKDEDGFFLMVEGGAVDWAGHGNTMSRLLEEQIDFDNAVADVIAWVDANSSWEETLLIVTADHETGFLTGPGKSPNVDGSKRGDLTGYEWNSGSHTNALVPMFAFGAGAEMFDAFAVGVDPVRGLYVDNTDVFKVINASIPEPASLALLALGGAALIARRRSA